MGTSPAMSNGYEKNRHISPFDDQHEIMYQRMFSDFQFSFLLSKQIDFTVNGGSSDFDEYGDFFHTRWTWRARSPWSSVFLREKLLILFGDPGQT